MTGSFRHFSVKEIDAGMQFALTTHNVHLDRDTLRNIADKTGIKWYEEGRKSGMLLQAKRDALDEYLKQYNKTESHRRNVYSRTVGKLFSTRNKHRNDQKRAQKEAPKRACSVDPNDIGIEKSGQYMLFLPQAS